MASKCRTHSNKGVCSPTEKCHEQFMRRCATACTARSGLCLSSDARPWVHPSRQQAHVPAHFRSHLDLHLIYSCAASRQVFMPLSNERLHGPNLGTHHELLHSVTTPSSGNNTAGLSYGKRPGRPTRCALLQHMPQSVRFHTNMHVRQPTATHGTVTACIELRCAAALYNS